MRSSRRVLPNALILTLLAAACCASLARAQFFDPALGALELTTAPITRSPRLIGMGGLSIVIPDRDHDLNLWDFAGLPVGALLDDSVSTLDLRPASDAASGVHWLPDGRERQDLAARDTRVQLESVFRNSETHSGFGLLADLNGLRWDHPTDEAIETRERISQPMALPLFGGRFPWLRSGRMTWALSGRFGQESLHDDPRTIVSNASGEYIGLDGTTLTPTDLFTPIQYDVNVRDVGASVAYRIGSDSHLGLGYDLTEDRIRGKNDQVKSVSATSEDRPYSIGQAALVGRLGRNLEYGVTGRGWTSQSQSDWRFTVSAGVGAFPFEGRGKLLTREERGSSLDGRLRWQLGHASIGGSLFTRATRVAVDPPGAGDLSSLNHFLDLVYNRPGADTLALPDSIVHAETRHFVWGFGTGAAYDLRHATIGAEWHWARDLQQDQATAALGPRREEWAARFGIEVPYKKTVHLRAGFVRRRVDLDTYTPGNEYNANDVTAGIGLQPVGSSWAFEGGYALEWRWADFDDPTYPRQGRNNAAAQIHWSF